MRRFQVLGFAAAALLVALPTQARDSRLRFSIQEALDSPDAKDRLDGSVRFFFGKQPHPEIAENFGTDMANRKTSGAGKSDHRSCEWVFLSSLLSLQQRALRLGADAVIDIVSVYRDNEFVSETQFECHAGNWMSGVALQGRFVRLKKEQPSPSNP